MSMMGGTALLEELLAEQAARDIPAQPSEEPEPENGHLESSAPDIESSSIGGLNASMGSKGPFSPASRVPLISTGDSVGGLAALGEEDLMPPPPSPLSRQIAELAQEMDDCLENFGEQWEDEKRKHREALMAALEVQYSGSHDEALDDIDVVDADEAMHGCRSDIMGHLLSAPGFASPSPVETGSAVSLGAADEVLARLREEEEASQRADEARISQLRAEVEELKRRADIEDCPDSPPLHGDYGIAERGVGTPHPGLVLDASLGASLGLDDKLGLSAWRAEVDAVLAGDDSLEDDLCATPVDAVGFTSLEGRLAGARERVRQLEDAVESAKACAEGELGELDQLLSECEELHAQLASRNDELGAIDLMESSMVSAS